MQDDCHFKSTVTTLCVVLSEKKGEFELFYNGSEGETSYFQIRASPPKLSIPSGKICEENKQNSYHANQARFFPAPSRRGRHTPDHARVWAWVLHPQPRPSRGPLRTSLGPTAPTGSAGPEKRNPSETAWPGPDGEGELSRTAGRGRRGRAAS